MKKKKVLIVPDSFKGSLSAKEVADSIASAFPNNKFEAITLPVSDGGDGVIDVLLANKGFEKKGLKIFNANGIIKETEYLIDKRGAVYIAVSGASGIQDLNKATLNPLKASTFGTGEVMNYVIDSGIKVINLFLGGSATIDGGTGMVAALGTSFYEGDNKITPYDTNPLIRYDSLNIDTLAERMKGISTNLISDVDNPITGEFGAARIYGPQKGADSEKVEMIESRMLRWVEFLEKRFGKELKHLPGMGAAGGIGLPIMASSDCKIFQGAEWFIEKLNIRELIDRADVVITGEGSIDRQTSMGKIPGEIAGIAANKGKVVIGVCGKSDGKAENFDQVYSLINQFNVSEKYAMTNTKELLIEMAKSIASKIMLASKIS